jgi:hypothetical protein
VKNDHHKCNDYLVIKQVDVPNYVRIVNSSSSQMDSFKKKMEKILEEGKEKLLENYKQYVSGSLGILGSDTINIGSINNSTSLKHIKENFNIEVTDDDSILISPNFNAGKEDIDDDLEIFRENLDKTLTKFSDLIGKVKFYNSGSISLNLFKIHNLISRESHSLFNL